MRNTLIIGRIASLPAAIAAIFLLSCAAAGAAGKPLPGKAPEEKAQSTKASVSKKFADKNQCL